MQRAALLATFLLGASVAGAQPVTALYYTGSPLSFISGGKTATLAPAAGYTFLTATGVHFPGDSSPDYVSIQVNNFSVNEFWSIALAPPKGQALARGTYLNATRYGFQDPSVPGLDFSGDGRGNNTLTGYFTILEVKMSNGQLASFAADFTQYDEGATASWNYGSIRYNSSIPLNLLPPPPVQPLSVACTNADGPVVKGSLYSYSSTCLASGGVAPYSWSIVNGQLPAGLTLQSVSPSGSGSSTISGKPSAVGPFSYTVQVTDSQNQTATQAFAGVTADTTCVPAGTFRTTTPTFRFGPSGGGTFIQVTFISQGCPWTLTADVPGVTITSSSGFTAGFETPITTSFTVAPNPDPLPRLGNLILEESGVVVQTFPLIVNSTSCTYSLNPTSAHFGGEGGAGSFTVTSSPQGCYPFPVYQGPNAPAAHLDGSTYYYGIPPNSGPARTGVFQVSSGSSQNAMQVAALTWTQDAGDNSLVLMCYPPGAPRVGSFIAECLASGGTPPYTWTVSDGQVPGGVPSFLSGSSVSFGNPVVPGPYNFTVKITDSSKPAGHAATYTSAGAVLAAPPQLICSSSAGPARSGTSYALACMPRFGTPPYQWSIAAGTLPDGLTLTAIDGGGVSLSGTPTAAGSYAYTLQLADSSAPAVMTAIQSFSGTIVTPDSSPSRFAITCTASNASYELGAPIAPIGCAASGGTPPYNWSVHTGELPPGLTFSSSTGNTVTIGGTPTAEVVGGYFYLYIKAVDSSSAAQQRLWSLVLGITNPPSFTCSPAPGQVGQAYYASCSGLGSGGWVSAGMLPPGLTISYNGITGTPTTPGSYTFTIALQDTYYPTPVTASHSYTIAISPAPPLLGGAITGAMPQIASGDGWVSTTVLVNTGSNYARANVGFLSDDGAPSTVPLLISPGGAMTTSSALNEILPPHSVMTMESQATGALSPAASWAGLAADSGVSGFTRFRFTPWDQEALVPLDTTAGASETLSFDNTNGIVTTVALANLTASPGNVTAVIRDDAGNTIESDQVALSAMGHSAFVLTDRFAVTSNRSGTIEFDSPQGGRISVLGFRLPDRDHFTTIPVAVGAPSGVGTFSHLAFGGGWSTTLELVNTSDVPAQAHLKFFGNDGSPLSLPLNVAGTLTVASALDQTLGPRQRIVIDSSDPNQPAVEGSAQLSAAGTVNGYIRFRYQSSGQEAIVPLETRNAKAYFLVFDDRNGESTGVALANLSSTDLDVPVSISDAVGNPIGSGIVSIPANGHTSFLLPQRFLPAVNQSGSVEFDVPTGGAISVLGLRVNPSGVFSTIPVMAP